MAHNAVNIYLRYKLDNVGGWVYTLVDKWLRGFIVSCSFSVILQKSTFQHPSADYQNT